ncbi:MAG: hypothetical protein EHM41_16280, partial [Chloroflexi bacterium]
KALILAGGLGTRLRPLLNDRPKPMAPIAGKPFLEYLLLQLSHYHVQDIILSIGYQAKLISDYFEDGKRWNLQIQYSYEEQPLGTAGAVKLAEDYLQGDTFLVLNGDSFFNLDLTSFIQQHHSKNAQATIALSAVESSQRYGRIELDQDGQILRFLEKSSEEGSQHTTSLINAGVYLFNRPVLDIIPSGIPVSLEREIFPVLIGRQFYGVPYSAFFIDIGVPEDYLKLQQEPGRLLDFHGS